MSLIVSTPESVAFSAHPQYFDEAYLVNVPDGRVLEANLIGVDTPTDIAVLQAGDVITKYDGKTVKTPNGLRAWIGVSEQDSVHKLSYIRKDGIENTVEIKVGTQKDAIIASLEQLGATIRPLRPSDNRPAHVRGAFVESVRPGSAVEQSGLLAGDVIGGINNEEAETMHESNELMSVSRGRARLLVYRFGVAIPLFIEQ